MKKTLSKNNAVLKTIFPLLISLLINIFVFAFSIKQGILGFILLFGSMTLGILWTYRKYVNSYNLFYNEDYLMLKNGKYSRNIVLNNIKRVKLTLSDMRIMGSQFYEYKIDFINEIDHYETVSCFVSNLNSNLWKFQDLVKSKSPNAEIENSARSWED